MVYGVPTLPISGERIYTTSLVGIIQTSPLLSSYRDFRLFYSRGFQFFQGSHIVYRDDGRPLLNLILQMGPVPVENFTVSAFHFLLVDSQPLLDIFSCHVSKDDFCIIIVFGIDSSSHCRPCSKVDFIHFMWRHFE